VFNFINSITQSLEMYNWNPEHNTFSRHLIFVSSCCQVFLNNSTLLFQWRSHRHNLLQGSVSYDTTHVFLLPLVSWFQDSNCDPLLHFTHIVSTAGRVQAPAPIHTTFCPCTCYALRAGVAQSVCPTTDWTTEVRNPTDTTDFSSSLCVQTRSEAYPASYQMGTSDVSLE
jgi:hypothetical protein